MNQNQYEANELLREEEELVGDEYSETSKEEEKRKSNESESCDDLNEKNESLTTSISSHIFFDQASKEFLKSRNSSTNIEKRVIGNDFIFQNVSINDNNFTLLNEMNESNEINDELLFRRDSSLSCFRSYSTNSMPSKELQRSFSLLHLRSIIEGNIFDILEKVSRKDFRNLQASNSDMLYCESESNENLLFYVYVDNKDTQKRVYFRGDVWSRLLWVTEEYVQRIQRESLIQKTLKESDEKLLCKDVNEIFTNIPFFTLKKTQECMKYSLHYICTTYNIRYTSNLSLVFAPFLFLTSASLSLPTAIACFIQFITQYLELLKNNDPLLMATVFDTFLLLLKYHDPQLCNFLVKHSIQLEPYFKAWFLTLLASKQNLLMILLLWDYYIAVNNKFLCFFLSIALLSLYREVLFSCDLSKLQEKILLLNINDIPTLSQVLKLSNVIKKRTPLSYFSIRSSLKQCKKTSWLTFTKENQSFKKHQMFYVTGNEVFRNLYKVCHNTQLESNTLLLYLIDIRNEKTLQEQRLPFSVLINITKENWRSDILNLLSFPLTPLSNKENIKLCTFKNLHICLMGHENSTLNDKMIRLVFCFLVDQCLFPYISVLYGGYKALYNSAKQFEKSLRYHDKTNCQACLLLFSFCASKNSNDISSTCFKRYYSNPLPSQNFSLTKKFANVELRPPHTENKNVTNNFLLPYQYIKFSRNACNSNLTTTFNKDTIFRLLKNRKHVIFKTFSCAPYFFNNNFQYLHLKSSESLNQWCEKQVSYIPLSKFEETKICVFLCFIKLISIPITDDVESVFKKKPTFYVPTQALCQFVLTSTDIVIVSRLLDPSFECKTLSNGLNNNIIKTLSNGTTQPLNLNQELYQNSTDLKEPFVIQYYKVPHQFVVYMIELQKNSGSCLFCSDFNVKKEYDLCVVTFLNNKMPDYIGKRLQEILLRKSEEKLQ